MRKLHIYRQKDQHDNVVIIGTTEALMALKTRIEKVLKDPKSAAMLSSVCTDDGENYEILIYNTEGELLKNKSRGEDVFWQNLALPYTNSLCQSNASIDPISAIGTAEYWEAKDCEQYWFGDLYPEEED